MADERPSWFGDTLSGEDADPLTAELAAFNGNLDHLDELLLQLERESDRPPPDNPPAEAAQAA